MESEDTRARLTQAGLNLIQQALSIFDSDLRLAVSNQKYRQMFDLPEELAQPGAPFEDTIRYLVLRGEYGEVDDPEEAVRARVEQARTFQPHYMERKRANGRTISVEGSPLQNGGWVTVYTDITEIKQQEALLRSHSAELSDQVLAHAERLAAANRELAAANTALEEAKRELTEMEARTRLVTEMMPAHIAHVGPDLRYTFSNRRLSTVMPGSLSDIVGRRVEDALGAANFAPIEPRLKRALSGEAAVFEITHESSGRRIRIALTPDAGGQGVYILSTDVTEEAQARAALGQTAKRELAAQLTSGLAHDFANLLTIIMGLQGRHRAHGGIAARSRRPRPRHARGGAAWRHAPEPDRVDLRTARNAPGADRSRRFVRGSAPDGGALTSRRRRSRHHRLRPRGADPDRRRIGAGLASEPYPERP